MAAKRSNLYLFTFLSIFFTLFIVGAVLSPLFLDKIRSTYLAMNEDVNRRQAKIISDIIASLLERGENQKAIISAVQSSLAHTEMDRGYLCLVDEKSGLFVAHPIKKYIGKKSSSFYKFLLKNNQQESADSRQENAKDISGIMTFSGGRTELINSFQVPDTSLRVFSHDNINRLNTEISKLEKAFIIIFILLGFIVAFPASYAALKVSRRYEKAIEMEQARSEKLLLNILPFSIAQRLKAEETNIANRYEDVSVLFIDMVDFTPLAATMSPEKLVELLNDIFSRFDAISKKHGLEKIKTIGDAYMVAGGIPEFKPDHLQSCVHASLEMLDLVKTHYYSKHKVNIRIGLHTGPLIAGVIGTYKFTYDLWGETVNIASRLESTSLPGKIHCSEPVYERMKKDYTFTSRGKILLKGVGETPTYFLEAERPS
ncbi:adenylate/guanylate cyclase domain-containing protein [Legionella spiritensis]|uniref:Adenylate cyclase n=1 Tax=Legionella spiritensis TaxID=452 RepID=A0A0W0Z7Z0_LEGSP|nr:adenylate/guanylate cyclase domain-containing protein [Legionella spiritensis]KTD65253.1 guanylate cyclase [Legionella spiritensis]SNV30276.1 guanylate cyclase [Legionella spiritensis]